MIFQARGLKAWIAILIAVIIAIVILVLIFNLMILLLPIVIILLILSYFFRMLNKVKKAPKKDYIDIKHKVK
tara:strand:- start:226 stop:441 length:216 start_codon:yes stop_codon:yes gene_type:complete